MNCENSRVIALDMDGKELWGSVALEGVAAGSPVTSDDGDYVFLTTNSNIGTIGHFFVISAALDGTAFYTQSNSTSPFSPPGIYHSPAEGYYDTGVGNTNDIIIWSVAPKPGNNPVGDGAIFGFQFPVDFDDTSSGENVAYIQLGAVGRDFQTNNPPVLTNEGRSLYWGVSRSSYRAWVGSPSSPGLPRFRFDGGHRFSRELKFNDIFRGESVFAAPALSSDPLEPFMFGSSASAQFAKLTWDFNETLEIVVTTDSFVTTTAKIDDDKFVYYIESANGRVHQANFEDLSDRFAIDLNFEVEGESALSKDGSILYVASTNGNITALQLGEIPETPSPTSSPTVSTMPPTSSPTKAPTTSPTEAPTTSPTEVPTISPTTASPTQAPITSAPSLRPTIAPTTGSTVEPTIEPTMGSSASQLMPVRTMALVAVAAVLFL